MTRPRTRAWARSGRILTIGLVLAACMVGCSVGNLPTHARENAIDGLSRLFVRDAACIANGGAAGAPLEDLEAVRTSLSDCASFSVLDLGDGDVAEVFRPGGGGTWIVAAELSESRARLSLMSVNTARVVAGVASATHRAAVCWEVEIDVLGESEYPGDTECRSDVLAVFGKVEVLEISDLHAG